MHRKLLPLVLLLCLALPASGAQAAKPTLKKAIWGPIERDGQSQFPIYEDLGVGIYQQTINWDQVAPTRPIDPSNPADPAYNWPTSMDTAIAEGKKHDIEVMLMLIGSPGWANGNRAWNYAPDKASDFAAFASAAAERYPGVRHWMIWSEPTKSSNFQPLEPDRGKPLRGAKALEGPHRYAQILDASYAALKKVSKRNLIIGGNTFTVGTVAPVRWVKALKLPGGRRPRMDLWGHNAFSARIPKLSSRPLGNGFADLSDIDNFARVLDRAFKRAKPRKMRHLKIFISEISVPTDHPNFEFNFYVDKPTQAKWISAGLRITRKLKRVYTYGYLGLYDDPVRPDNDQVERGLLTRSGEKKPGYAAFKNG
jgi:hypothetical protein